MILGDPCKFSIFVKTIKEWNIDNSFCNGILFFCINGGIYPKEEIIVATLKCEIPKLKEHLMNIAINNELYYMQKQKAFEKIYNITFPENFNIDNDYRYDISPISFSDNHIYIFAVSNGRQVRILASKLNYIIEQSRHNLKNIVISEVFIDIKDLNKIISNLKID